MEAVATSGVERHCSGIGNNSTGNRDGRHGFRKRSTRAISEIAVSYDAAGTKAPSEGRRVACTGSHHDTRRGQSRSDSRTSFLDCERLACRISTIVVGVT